MSQPEENINASETAQQKIREHLANGGTVLCALTVPIGSQVLIMDNKGQLSAVEVGLGEILPRDINETFVAFREVLNGPA